MGTVITMRKGTRAQLDSLVTTLNDGELLYCTDTKELYVGTGTTTKAPISIDINALSALGVVADTDLILMSDASESAANVKTKKITFADFKTALNIPAGSSDEKVSTASGATSGYLGTNGSDGILRASDGISMTAGGSNAYVTLKFELASQAQGDLIYRGASAWARLAAGTSGALLQSGGAGANPSWTTTITGGTF